MGEMLKAVAQMADPASDSTQNSKFKIQNCQVSRYWQSGPFHPQSFYWGWMPPHPTFFVRRGIYEKHGGFSTDLGSAADYALMLRLLLKHRLSCAYIPEVLVCMRQGGGQQPQPEKPRSGQSHGPQSLAGERVAAVPVDFVAEAGEEGGAVFLNFGFRISDCGLRKELLCEK